MYVIELFGVVCGMFSSDTRTHSSLSKRLALLSLAYLLIWQACQWYCNL